MSSGVTVRVGVIGHGIGARVVAPVFNETEGCAVVDVVSPRDDDAVSALCARDDVDLISVHSPPFLHLDHVRRAIDGGHAVLCDKPFGVNAVEAQDDVRLADATRGSSNFVNYEFRHHPVRSKLHALVLDGAVGKVEQVEWSAFAGIWRTRRGSSDGCSTPHSEAGGCGRTPATPSTSSAGRSARSSTPQPVSAPRSRSVPTPKGECARAPRKTASPRGCGPRTVRGSRSTRPRPRRSTGRCASRSSAADGVLEVLSDNVHEVGGRILLHTERGTSEQFRIDPWEEHHYTEMLPWVKLVRDAIQDGDSLLACPHSPTASPARA